MKISGMQKLTLLDYPGKTACLIFTQGCNFRCPFCQNSDLLEADKKPSIIPEEEVLAYLDKRKGILDGICISGGEPLLQPDLKEFIIKVKSLGYKVKLDTNGSSPNKLKDLIDNNLLDYVAMDIKNDFEDYGKTSGIEKLNLDNIKRSIKIIEESNIEYEFRTTVAKELHDTNKLESICRYIDKDAKYFIQNYRDCDTVLEQGKLTSFTEEELRRIQDNLNKYPNVIVRGI